MNISFSKELKTFINENKLLLTLLGVTAFLSYGFTITHFSIGIDNTNSSIYLDQFGLIAQGRFTQIFIHNFIFPMQEIPFWKNAVGVILIYFSAVLWAMLLKKAGGETITKGSVIVFATFMISYPIINELFIYEAIAYGLIYLLVAVALYFILSLKDEKIYIPKIIYSIVCLIFAVSFYESAASVFLCGLFMALILFRISNNERKPDPKKSLRILLLAFIVLVSAIIIEKALDVLAVNVFKPAVGWGGANNIIWGTESIPSTLKMLGIGMVYRYFLAGFWYFPISVLVAASIIGIIIALYFTIKKKSLNILLLFLGLGLSVISLSIIRGHVMGYRVCATFGIFISFIAMLIVYLLKDRKIKILAYILIVLLILNQTRVLNFWFVNDYQRYEHDREIALDVSYRIEKNNDTTKPVIFVGTIDKAPQVIKVANNGYPYLTWAINTEYPGEIKGNQFYIFLERHGHKFVKPTKEQISDGYSLALNLEEYPKNGCIVETDEIIVVNFGDHYNYLKNYDPRELKILDWYTRNLASITGWSFEYSSGQIGEAIKN